MVLQRILLSSLAPLWCHWPPPADLQRWLLMRAVLLRIWALMGQIPRDMCAKLGCTTPPLEGA